MLVPVDLISAEF